MLRAHSISLSSHSDSESSYPISISLLHAVRHTQSGFCAFESASRNMSVSLTLTLFVALSLTRYIQPLRLDLHRLSATHSHGLPLYYTITREPCISQTKTSGQLSSGLECDRCKFSSPCRLVKREAADPPVSIAQRAYKRQGLLVIRLTINTTLTICNIYHESHLVTNAIGHIDIRGHAVGNLLLT
jgi:hypothetical protein